VALTWYTFKFVFPAGGTVCSAWYLNGVLQQTNVTLPASMTSNYFGGMSWYSWPNSYWDNLTIGAASPWTGNQAGTTGEFAYDAAGVLYLCTTGGIPAASVWSRVGLLSPG